MRKLTAGIFSVLLGLVSVGGANAAVVSTEYLSEVLQTELADMQTKTNILTSAEVNDENKKNEVRYVSAAAAEKIAQDAVGVLTGGIADMDADESADAGHVMTGVVQEDGKITEIKQAQITNDFIADDAAIAKGKLASDVQASLGLADNALQKADIVTGTANGTINVEGSDVAVAGLGTAAYKADTDFDAAGTALSLVSDAKSELQASINLKANIADVYSKTEADAMFEAQAAATEKLQAAKDYADAQIKTLTDNLGGTGEDGSSTGLTGVVASQGVKISALEDKVGDKSVVARIAELDSADTAVDKEFVTAVSENDGVITVSRRALAAADIPVIAVTQVEGLQDALDAKQVSLTGQNGVIVIADGVISIASQGIGTVQLKDASVTADKMAKDSVTSNAIADNAVTAGKIADNAVEAGNLAAKAVLKGNIADGAVDTNSIADNAVGAAQLATEVNSLLAGAIQAPTSENTEGTFVLTAKKIMGTDGKVTYEYAWEDIAGRDE